MDGWITIGTKIDTNKFDKQVTDLENKIKQEEDKQKINIEVGTQLEQEQAKITRQVEELTAQYQKAVEQAEKLKAVVSLTEPRWCSSLYGGARLQQSNSKG